MNAKLLNHILGREVEEVKLDGDYLNYEYKFPRNKGEYHTSGIALTTLGLLCKEWCLKQGYAVFSREDGVAWFDTPNHDFIEDVKITESTELKAIIKATEWIIREKD